MLAVIDSVLPSNVRFDSTFAPAVATSKVNIPLSVLPANGNDVPPLPDVPELNPVADVPDVPVKPDVPDVVPGEFVPDVPFTPEVPEVPKYVPSKPDVPLLPVVPEVPDVIPGADVPDEPAVPDVTP